MKRGSSVRKCEACGDKIFWLIPTGEIICGCRVMNKKEVKPWLMRENKYWCKECYAKHLKAE